MRAIIITWIGGGLTVKTAKGVIVLEDFTNDCQVSVDGHAVTVSWPGGEKPGQIEISPGEHRVKVTRGNDELLALTMTIAAGGVDSFTLRREQPDALVAERNDDLQVGVIPVEPNTDAEMTHWPAAPGSDGQALDAGQHPETVAATGDSGKVDVPETPPSPKDPAGPAAKAPRPRTAEVKKRVNGQRRTGRTACACEPAPPGRRKMATRFERAQRGSWQHHHSLPGRLDPWGQGGPARVLVTKGFDPALAMAQQAGAWRRTGSIEWSFPRIGTDTTALISGA